MWSPLGHEPMNQAARWQPEPATRGTFNILSTCLTTLVLCVWTALHLNIPETRKKNRQKWRKAWWLILGLLTPELVTVVAFDQWLRHKRLTKAMMRSLGKLGSTRQDMGLEANHTSELSSTHEDNELLSAQTVQGRCRRRRYQWTPVHSFYALMGGFVFDNSRNPEEHLFRGREQVTIHRNLLMWLAENDPDMLPDISSGHISDKSKTNGVEKFVVCVQASWFGLQVITRLGQGFAITLLELNTFAHVVCTLLTYIFWWNKPLDINEPTAIYTDNPKASSICAAFWSRASMGHDTPLVIRRATKSSTEPMRDLSGETILVDQVVLSPQRAQELWSHCFDASSVTSHQGSRYFSDQAHASEDVLLRLNAGRTHRLKENDNFEDGIFIELDGNVIEAELERSNIHLHPGVFGPNDRVYVVFKDYHLQRHLCAYNHPSGLKLLGLVSPDFKFHKMRPRARNWSLSEGDDMLMATDLYLLLTAGVLYGAWHLTAWNGPFRTTTEDILWKLSAVSVAAGPILEIALPILMAGAAYSVGVEYIEMSDTPKPFSTVPFPLPPAAIFYFFSFLLIFSRTYLVIEPFISLAFVPNTVFAVPRWSTYFPHIG